MRDFDVFAFSVSFEWDYTNVVAMLRLAGLEPRASMRHWQDPLVVIGGAVTFVNPEPLAPFADLIAAGEGELLVPSIIEAIADVGTRDRPALLERLATERGCYVPSLYDVIYDGPGRVAAIRPIPARARRPSFERPRSRPRTTSSRPPRASSRQTPSSGRGC